MVLHYNGLKPRSKKTPAGVSPWTAEKAAEIDQSGKGGYIFLLTDAAGARLLGSGVLPEDIREQAERAIDWMALDERREGLEEVLQSIAGEEGLDK